MHLVTAPAAVVAVAVVAAVVALAAVACRAAVVAVVEAQLCVTTPAAIAQDFGFAVDTTRSSS